VRLNSPAATAARHVRRKQLTRCGRLCIAASDTMLFVRGDEQRSSSTEIIPDGKLLAILAT
jgi:hypothetical protein